MSVRSVGSLTGALVVAVTAVATPLLGQEVHQLGSPSAQSAEPFSQISGLRALSDGSLLVSDGLEGRLLSVSADLSAARPLGREGAGPTEYRTPDMLYSLAADSTLMVDLGNGRMAVLTPSGDIVRTIPMSSGEGMQMQLMLPGGVDNEGRVFFRGMGMMGGGIPDSAEVKMFDPRTEDASTMASVKLPEMNEQTSGGANNQNSIIRPVPLSRQDDWTVTPGGDLVLARSGQASYWLEFVNTGGARRGPEIAYSPHRVGNADKDDWVDGMSNALGIGITNNNGRMQTTFSRGGRGAPDPDEFEWPETKPAFPAGALSISSDGNVWLLRHTAAGEPPTYDILDMQGQFLGSVILPEDRTLEGFGDGSVYLSRSDDLDFVWLERYDMPAL
jgi:hypothetical protein